MMTGAAKWLRRFEMVLVVSGILFLGGAFAATVHRWHFQNQQERALNLVTSTVAPRPDPVTRAPRPSEDAAEPLVARTVEPVVLTGAPSTPPPTRELDPLTMGIIEIPRVGVRAIVREGEDHATLALAVGHVPGTARPGDHGNTVLAGHRDTFFRGLRNIRMNDQVRFVVPPHSYEYRVVAMNVVAPDETSVLASRGTEELTLVTCYPFRYVGNAPDRFIVRATRVR